MPSPHCSCRGRALRSIRPGRVRGVYCLAVLPALGLTGYALTLVPLPSVGSLAAGFIGGALALMFQLYRSGRK